MSKRTERRAAERTARQLAANRANAQLSQGPITPEGKAKSSLNALKHGLTSRTAVLDSEDAAEYTRRFDSYVELWGPATQEEWRLVQSLLDCAWRIERIHRIESSIFLKGKLEFASNFAAYPEDQRAALILLETQTKYEKMLKNLHLQEARLRRYAEKDQAQLELLQQARLQSEEQAGDEQSASPQPSTIENGFVFSTPAHGCVSVETEPTEPLAQAA